MKEERRAPAHVKEEGARCDLGQEPSSVIPNRFPWCALLHQCSAPWPDRFSKALPAALEIKFPARECGAHSTCGSLRLCTACLACGTCSSRSGYLLILPAPPFLPYLPMDPSQFLLIKPLMCFSKPPYFHYHSFASATHSMISCIDNSSLFFKLISLPPFVTWFIYLH